MKIRENDDHAVRVELSESNLRALLADFEANGSTCLTRSDQGVIVQVTVRCDESHYTLDEWVARGGSTWKGAANA